ncbi:MAG: hypothetical protein RSA53_05560 [Odoribacter sp.]
MNKQNFEAKDRFPLSTEALTFMQNMIMASAQLALIGGNRYILSGCVTTGNTVSSGIIVLDGEIMPFDGGNKVDTITIVETVESVSANGLTFENARVIRKAKFATGTGANYYPWMDFLPLKTNQKLEEVKATVKYVDDEIAKIQAGSIPKGIIVMWGGEELAIPSGWCLCDGRTLKDGNKVPDLRGRFIVGYNRDDADYNKIKNTGGNRQISLKEENTPPHKHLNGMADDKDWSFKKQGSINQQSSSSCLTTEGGTAWYQGYTSSDGAAAPFDIRPPYYVLAFLIKI